MAGRIIRVLERTKYDYSLLPASALIDIKLADLDVSGASEVTLLIRVHESVITASSGTFKIVTKASAPTNEDPGKDFYDPTALATSAAIDDAPGAPFLLRSAMPANCGAWITVFLQVVQGGGGATNLSATLSIDASLKE